MSLSSSTYHFWWKGSCGLKPINYAITGAADTEIIQELLFIQTKHTRKAKRGIAFKKRIFASFAAWLAFVNACD